MLPIIMYVVTVNCNMVKNIDKILNFAKKITKKRKLFYLRSPADI